MKIRNGAINTSPRVITCQIGEGGIRLQSPSTIPNQRCSPHDPSQPHLSRSPPSDAPTYITTNITINLTNMQLPRNITIRHRHSISSELGSENRVVITTLQTQQSGQARTSALRAPTMEKNIAQPRSSGHDREATRITSHLSCPTFRSLATGYVQKRDAISSCPRVHHELSSRLMCCQFVKMSKPSEARSQRKLSHPTEQSGSTPRPAPAGNPVYDSAFRHLKADFHFPMMRLLEFAPCLKLPVARVSYF